MPCSSHPPMIMVLPWIRDEETPLSQAEPIVILECVIAAKSWANRSLILFSSGKQTFGSAQLPACIPRVESNRISKYNPNLVDYCTLIEQPQRSIGIGMSMRTLIYVKINLLKARSVTVCTALLCSVHILLIFCLSFGILQRRYC